MNELIEVQKKLIASQEREIKYLRDELFIMQARAERIANESVRLTAMLEKALKGKKS